MTDKQEEPIKQNLSEEEAIKWAEEQLENIKIEYLGPGTNEVTGLLLGEQWFHITYKEEPEITDLKQDIDEEITTEEGK